MSRPHRAIAALILLAALAGTAAVAVGAEGDGEPGTSDRKAKLAILEAYVDALVSGDFSAVPMTDDVTFQNPYQAEPIEGLETVQQYEIDNFSSTIAGVQDDISYIIDGDEAVAIFVLDMEIGVTVPTADYFRFEDGRIAEIRPYFDTGIFTKAQAAAADDGAAASDEG